MERNIYRPLTLTVYDDEGSWDLVCAEAGDD